MEVYVTPDEGEWDGRTNATGAKLNAWVHVISPAGSVIGDAGAGSGFTVDAPVDTVWNQPVFVNVTLTYNAKGSVTDAPNSKATSSINMEMHNTGTDISGFHTFGKPLVHQKAGEAGTGTSFDIRDQQVTYSFMTAYGKLTSTSISGRTTDGMLVVQLSVGSPIRGDASAEVTINSTQIEWIEPE